MCKTGKGLLQAIQRLEKILDHKLAITADIIDSRILALVDKQLKELDIKKIKIDNAEVNWDEIIRKALFRLLLLKTIRRKKVLEMPYT